jgi:hypothetical protein
MDPLEWTLYKFKIDDDESEDPIIVFPIPSNYGEFVSKDSKLYSN